MSADAAAVAAELRRLDAAAEEAEAAWREAREGARRRSMRTGQQVLAPLADYYRAVETRRRGEDPGEARRLQREAFELVERDGLLVQPFDATRPGAGFRVHDPRPQAALDAALAEVREARRARDDFAREHQDELAREAGRAEAERIREALRGDDPGAIREALSPATAGAGAPTSG